MSNRINNSNNYSRIYNNTINSTAKKTVQSNGKLFYGPIVLDERHFEVKNSPLSPGNKKTKKAWWYSNSFSC